MMLIDPDQYVNTAQAAAKLGKTKSTLRVWRHRGYGPKAIMLGARALYAKDELEDFVRRLGIRP